MPTPTHAPVSGLLSAKAVSKRRCCKFMSAGYRSHFGSQRFSPRITDRTNKGAELFRSGAYYNPSNLLVSLSIRPLGSELTVDQACLGPAKRGHPLIAQASDGVRPGREIGRAHVGTPVT